MQDDQQKRKIIAKRIIIVALVLITIFAIGIGVSLLLKNVTNLAKNQSNTSTDTDTQTSSAPSAASIIGDYIKPESMRIFSEKYQLQQDATAPSRIAYTAEGRPYEVSLTTEQYALFYAKDGAAHADASIVESQTTAFMQEKGFQVAKTKDPALTVNYTDSGNVCQLTKSPQSMPSYYLMACADKSDVDNEYATIERLLDIYKKSHQIDTFTRALSTTITSDNKAMTTISLTIPNKHPVLLFAAVNDNWTYIGDVGSGNEATSNGKYSLTTEVQNAIHDPKYGDFLAKNLQ